MQVSGLLFAIGWALSCVGLTPLVIFMTRIKPDDAGYLVIPLPFGLVAMLLAVPPTATRVIAALCVGVFAAQTALSIFLLLELIDFPSEVGTTQRMECFGVYLPILVVCALTAIALAPALLPSRWCACIKGRCFRGFFFLHPRLKLRRLWLAMRFFLLGIGAVLAVPQAVLAGLKSQCARRGNDPKDCALADDWGLVITANSRSSDNSPLIEGLALFVPAACAFLLCALVTTAANRGRFLRRLGQIGKVGDEQQQAASVAALVGGSRPGKVLELGARRFRTLPLDAIAEADLLTNKDTGLHGKTANAELGR